MGGHTRRSISKRIVIQLAQNKARKDRCITLSPQLLTVHTSREVDLPRSLAGQLASPLTTELHPPLRFTFHLLEIDTDLLTI